MDGLRCALEPHKWDSGISWRRTTRPALKVYRSTHVKVLRAASGPVGLIFFLVGHVECAGPRFTTTDGVLGGWNAKVRAGRLGSAGVWEGRREVSQRRVSQGRRRSGVGQARSWWRYRRATALGDVAQQGRQDRMLALGSNNGSCSRRRVGALRLIFRCLRAEQIGRAHV